MNSAMKVTYRTKPGEQLKLLPDGRAVVAHPERPPKVVTPDGRVEELTRKNHPDIWQSYILALTEIIFADDKRTLSK